MNNLWEVSNLQDMVESMSQGEFALLALVTEDTPVKHRAMIRKSIKQKAATVANCQFIYYVVKEGDFGKILPLVDGNKALYPRMFFVKDAKNILFDAVDVTKDNTVPQFMATVDTVYQRLEMVKLRQQQAKEQEQEQLKLQSKLSHLVKKGNENQVKFFKEVGERKLMEEGGGNQQDEDDEEESSQDVVSVDD